MKHTDDLVAEKKWLHQLRMKASVPTSAPVSIADLWCHGFPANCLEPSRASRPSDGTCAMGSYHRSRTRSESCFVAP